MVSEGLTLSRVAGLTSYTDFMAQSLRSLQKEVMKQEPNWESLFEQTAVLCNVIQEPQYKLLIQKN